ncbi:MAG: hypothetical protein AAGC85_17415 [Bacteroidota bacterium]
MMKQLSFCFILLLYTTILFSQDEKPPTYLTIGYLGNVAIHPGGKVGLQLPLKPVKLFSDENTSHTLVISPQAATYFRGRREYALFFQNEVGILRKKEGRNVSHILGVGLGYLGESILLSESVSLGTGEITGSDREWKHFFLPTLNYEIGSNLGDSLRWYVKAISGPKLGEGRWEVALFVEAGVKLSLKSSNR